MKKAQLLALLAVCGMVTTAWCCDKDKAAKGQTPCSKNAKGQAPCHKAGGAALAALKGEASSEGCPIAKKVDAILASLPTMHYMLDGKPVECSQKAASLEKEGKPLKYVVGDTTFDNKGDAMVRLAAVLQEEAKQMQEVTFAVGGKTCKCPLTAKRMAKESKSKLAYRIGGVDFDSKDEAEKVATLVKDALSNVKMKYKVGDKTFCCDRMAGAEAEKTGKKMTYVVGKDETCCSKTAKLKAAESTIRTIAETAAKASLGI